MSQIQGFNKTESYRFDIYAGSLESDGRFTKRRNVGHAYLRTGSHVYKTKLFGALSERFVIAPTVDPHRYEILTNEDVQTKDKGKRCFWNIVGEGRILSAHGLLQLDFDLYGRSLFMSLYPSSSAASLPFSSGVERLAVA